TDSPRGPKSPEHSTERASVLSPRTSVLICVLMDSHGCHVCADGHTRTARDPQTSCVCWRTPTDVLCVLNKQPTWAKITRTRAESKDQHADMCTDGQPQTSCVGRHTHTDTHEHTRTHTDVLCVLTDTTGRPVCADGQPLSATDSHGYSHKRPVCADGQPRTQPTWAKITQTVHRTGQRAE
ncbi:unnamed protein product, partial [Brassica rapa]